MRDGEGGTGVSSGFCFSIVVSAVSVAPPRRGPLVSPLCAFIISAGHAKDSGVQASLCVGLAGRLVREGRNAKHQGLGHE